MPARKPASIETLVNRMIGLGAEKAYVGIAYDADSGAWSIDSSATAVVGVWRYGLRLGQAGDTLESALRELMITWNLGDEAYEFGRTVREARGLQ